MLEAKDLNDLRKRVLADETYTHDEIAAAVKQLISDRLASFEAPTKSKSKAKPVNLDDLI